MCIRDRKTGAPACPRFQKEYSRSLECFLCKNYNGSITVVLCDAVDLWGRLYLDDESKDVELIVLRQLSVPFRCMLEHPMVEGQVRRIKLEAYTAVQLQFFLRLVYTGQVEASHWQTYEVLSEDPSIASRWRPRSRRCLSHC
eukprot:4209532-Alexandrium_andersonii.AAC.1